MRAEPSHQGAKPKCTANYKSTANFRPHKKARQLFYGRRKSVDIDFAHALNSFIAAPFCGRKIVSLLKLDQKLYSLAVLLQLSQLGKLVLQCGIDIAVKLIELLVLGNCCCIRLLNLVGTYNSLASLGHAGVDACAYH